MCVCGGAEEGGEKSTSVADSDIPGAVRGALSVAMASPALTGPLRERLGRPGGHATVAHG